MKGLTWGIILGLHPWVYNQTMWGPSVYAHNDLVRIAPSLCVRWSW